MRADWRAHVAGVCRWLLLLLLAGHLLFRQAFAHRGLGDLFSSGETGAFGHAYVTEVVLAFLLPYAVILAWRRRHTQYELPASEARQRRAWGAPVYLALAFLGWGIAHAVIAVFTGGDVYLIFRQSALAGYSIFFLYTFIFLGDQARHVRQAVLVALVVALLCAALDAGASLAGPVQQAQHPSLAFLAEKPYGQETLPIAILGLSLAIVCFEDWWWRALALLALALAGWRQGARFQSVIPISLAGALALYLVLGAALALRGQVNTLRRAVVLLVLFGLLAFGYHRWHNDAGEPAEVKAWSWDNYGRLFDVYGRTTAPQDPKDFVFSTRAAVPVGDPEVYKLNAVSDACADLSVRNNIWRFLVWRRMALDWAAGRTFVGAGVGKPWFYGALYHTSFHYGEDRLGLDPHNSYLNLLYRYGAVGFLILVALLLSVLYYLWKALLIQPGIGDVLLECIVLYFFYTVVFVCFTVGLEGPSYSMPFWMALGLGYARARQLLYARDDALTV